MAKKLFLVKNIEKLKNKRYKTKGEILLFIDLISYLAVNKELSLNEAERYTYTLFRMMEEAGES